MLGEGGKEGGRGDFRRRKMDIGKYFNVEGIGTEE